jgi:NAD(P)-dependent dehydrogenase (short-subunit alcohol dehydrogenase family)
VVVTGRSKPEHHPDREHFIAAGTSTVEDAEAVVDAVARDGGLDIPVHVVVGSHAPSGGFAALSDKHWTEEPNLNLLGAVRLDRGLIPGHRHRCSADVPDGLAGWHPTGSTGRA